MNKIEQQCILCGRMTTNKSRVCDKCDKELQETFEENINNKTKNHDRSKKKR